MRAVCRVNDRNSGKAGKMCVGSVLDYSAAVHAMSSESADSQWLCVGDPHLHFSRVAHAYITNEKPFPRTNS